MIPREYEYSDHSTNEQSDGWVIKAILIAFFCFLGYILIQKRWDSHIVPFFKRLKDKEGLLNESKGKSIEKVVEI